MIMATCLKQVTWSSGLFWFGWLLMLAGLFLPIFNLLAPDPHMGQLLLWREAVIFVERGEWPFMGIPIFGIKVVFFGLMSVLSKASFSFMWLLSFLAIFSLLAALLAPLFVWVRVSTTNMLFTFALVFLLLNLFALLWVKDENVVIGLGYYIWMIALLNLSLSSTLRVMYKGVKQC